MLRCWHVELAIVAISFNLPMFLNLGTIVHPLTAHGFAGQIGMGDRPDECVSVLSPNFQMQLAIWKNLHQVC